MIISQGFASKTYNVPGFGYVTLNELQVVRDDSMLGKALLKAFPSICGTDVSVPKVQEEEQKEVEVQELLVEEPIPKEEPIEIAELLVEEPIEIAELLVEEPIPKEEPIEIAELLVEEPVIIPEVKPKSDFKSKEDLEIYARKTFKVELDKRKTLNKMYETLVSELNK